MDRLRGMIAGSGDKEEVEEDEVNALMPEGDHSDKKSRKQKGKNTLRKALFVGAAEYGAQLVEQVIRASGVEGNMPLSQVQVHGVSFVKVANADGSPVLTALLREFEKADAIIKECSSKADIKGYVTATPQKDSKELVYQDFMPFPPTHLPMTTTILPYDNVRHPTFSLTHSSTRQ